MGVLCQRRLAHSGEAVASGAAPISASRSGRLRRVTAVGLPLVVVVVGRYASDPSEPFPPRVEVRGMDVSDAVLQEFVEIARAAWESTAPWDAKDKIAEKAESWVARRARERGLGEIQVQAIVMDDLPKISHEVS